MLFLISTFAGILVSMYNNINILYPGGGWDVELGYPVYWCILGHVNGMVSGNRTAGEN